jgi:protein SCO1/2
MKKSSFAIILVLLVTPLTGCLKDSPSEEINGDEYNGTPLASGNAGDFSLIDRDSSNFTLSSLKGDITVVNFIFTSCPDVCPLDTSKLRTASNELGDDVKFVSITMDPEFDKVAILAEYSEIHGADWPHLTGNPEQLEDVWSDFGIIVDKKYNEEMEYFNSLSILHPTPINQVSVLNPDNSSNLYFAADSSLPSNATGWNLTTAAFNASNILHNYTTHEQWGHQMTGINGVNSPDLSWWWELLVWNASNSSWENPQVGIDSIEVTSSTQIAWAANNSNFSLLSPPLNFREGGYVKSHSVAFETLPDNTSGWNLTTAVFDDANISYNFTYHEGEHGSSMIDDRQSPSDDSWWWKPYSWNTTNAAWEETVAGIDGVEVGSTTHLAWAANYSDVSLIPSPVDAMDHTMMHGEMNYTIIHNAVIYVLDEEHDKRLAYIGSDWSSEDLVGDVRTLQSETIGEESVPALSMVLTLVAGLVAVIITSRQLAE